MRGKLLAGFYIQISSVDLGELVHSMAGKSALLRFPDTPVDDM